MRGELSFAEERFLLNRLGGLYFCWVFPSRNILGGLVAIAHNGFVIASFAQASSRKPPSWCPSYVLGCYSVSSLGWQRRSVPVVSFDQRRTLSRLGEEHDVFCPDKIKAQGKGLLIPKHGSVSVIQHDIFGGIYRVHETASVVFPGLVWYLQTWLVSDLSVCFIQLFHWPHFYRSGLLCIILYCLCVFKELRTVWNSFLALLHVPRSKHSALEDWGLGGLGMETKRLWGCAYVCHPIWVELGSKWKENIASDWNKTNRLHVRTTSRSGFYGVAWKKTF